MFDCSQSSCEIGLKVCSFERGITFLTATFQQKNRVLPLSRATRSRWGKTIKYKTQKRLYLNACVYIYQAQNRKGCLTAPLSVTGGHILIICV